MFRTFVVLVLLSAASAHARGGTVTGKVTAQGPTRRLVVYIEKVAGAAKNEATTKVVNTQKDTAFVPDVMIVRTGTPVDFLNQDKIYHNVFSLTPGSEFDLGLYRGGTSKATTFETPGEVDVFCNIHPNMSAKVLVVQNEFYTAVKPDGSYKLEGVPAGKYTLVAWSPDHKVEKKPIHVSDGGKAAADFSLTRRARAKQHLNKNGEQYGRYK